MKVPSKWVQLFHKLDGTLRLIETDKKMCIYTISKKGGDAIKIKLIIVISYTCISVSISLALCVLCDESPSDPGTMPIRCLSLLTVSSGKIILENIIIITSQLLWDWSSIIIFYL